MLRKIGFRHRAYGEPDSGASADSNPVVPVPPDKPTTESISRTAPAEITSAGKIPSRLKPGGDVHRSPSNANSEFPGAEREYPPPAESQLSDPLGLHLVRDDARPSGDIIFVHGLGGTAKKTWSWDRNVENFWPLWLADEVGLSSYRIFTFGYNSDFKGVGTNLNIIDFAKDLLFRMMTFSGASGEDRSPIGRRPIIFVAHSMGGIVVKKAFMLGKYADEYSGLISHVYGIVFLATPHRGAQYAKMLNNILSTAPLGAPPKAYISDLESHSRTLQDINEQFRTSCGELSLVSFFETLKTSFGISKSVVVEKESAVLGYPQETSSPLNADHHTVCKFQNPRDGNYISVSSVLKLWASKLSPERPPLQIQRPTSNFESFKKIETITGIRGNAEEDRRKAMGGTCRWIMRKEGFVHWLTDLWKPPRIKAFWLMGLPAMGKTVLASHVIDHLRSLGASDDCQFHFFSSSHQSKRTAAYCLRSIASQLAHTNEEFRERLFALYDETGVTFSSQDQNFSVIWEKIFEGIIFQLKARPLFWVLDAVDEADTPSTLLNSLMGAQSRTPIRVFLTSRPMKLPVGSAGYASFISTCFLSEEDTIDDIKAYVHNAVHDALPYGEQQIQNDIIDQVLAKAAGSFLWVKLALETLHDNWHTQDDIRKALTEVPHGMEHLYTCMLETIKTQNPRLQLMARRILTWAACCWRPLTTDELQVALEPEFTGFVRLRDTITQICGHFISVDNGKISLIHITARSFLLEARNGESAFIDFQSGHELIAITCLKHLSNDQWRRVFKMVENSTPTVVGTGSGKNRLLVAEQGHPFLGYATCYWAYHVFKSPVDSENLLLALKIFFNQYCLSWIEAVALSKNLRYLTRSARFLKAFAKKRSRRSISTYGSLLSLRGPNADDSENVHLWAADFIRIVGKFGLNLLQSPSSIYRLVPPFCPRASMIGSIYRSQNTSISVTGLPSEGWDDCLASVSVGQEETASKVVATDAYFITLVSSSGTVIVWHAETCEQARILKHEEFVSFITMNRSGTLLATAGTHSYFIWDISSGKRLFHLQKTDRALTMALAFGDSGSELIIGLDDCSITCYNLKSSQTMWKFTVPDQGEFLGCPRIMAFSPDLTRLALAWRGKPPLVWDMTQSKSQQPLRCSIRSSKDALCAPELIQWRDSQSVLVLCQNTIVEWQLYNEVQVEFDHVRPREMTMSKDGNFLLTSDSMGTISVWTFPRLSLIYQLRNENEYVKDLAFSPDAQRFYDTRGSICNVWEPDALVRADEHELEDQTSVGGDSVSTEPVITQDESSRTQVTALAYSSADDYFCAGRDDGTVTIHDARVGEKTRRVSTHSSTSSIINLVWSHTNKYIISSDDSGRIVGKRLQLKDNNKWSVFAVFDFRVGELVEQFLLNDSETLLLIATGSTDRVWDLGAKKELCCRHWALGKGRRWIQHPSHNELLVWIDPVIVHTYKWKTLDHSDSHQVEKADLASPAPNLSHGKVVHWVALTNNKRFIVYLSGPGDASTGPSSGLHLEFLSTSDLRLQHPHFLSTDCMADVAARIKRLIGTYQDKIVFLDHDYWLCTWDIDAGLDDIKRHFFLPRDWLSPHTLQMATLNAQGTFLCPKHGDVAIVRHGMRF